jgi:acyl-CoA dehydrogenase
VTIDGGRAIDDPAVRDHLADWFVASNGLLYTNYRTLTALAQGQQPGPENSISKIVAGNTMQAIASFALELQEQSGLLIEHEGSSLHEKFPRMLMRSLGTRIEGGSDEILRNIIAERVLQLPGDIRLDRDVPFNQIPSGA